MQNCTCQLFIYLIDSSNYVQLITIHVFLNNKWFKIYVKLKYLFEMSKCRSDIKWITSSWFINKQQLKFKILKVQQESFRSVLFCVFSFSAFVICVCNCKASRHFAFSNHSGKIYVKFYWLLQQNAHFTSLTCHCKPQTIGSLGTVVVNFLWNQLKMRTSNASGQ